jgi:hypothetical protein
MGLFEYLTLEIPGNGEGSQRATKGISAVAGPGCAAGK